MRLNNEFLLYNTKNNGYLVPVGSSEFSGLVKGNRTVGVILDYLQVDTTEDEIVRKMLERFDATEELIRRDVKDTVAKLRSIGAIDE